MPLHFLNWVSNCIFVIIILAYGIQLWIFFLIVIKVKILVQNKEAVPLANSYEEHFLSDSHEKIL